MYFSLFITNLFVKKGPLEISVLRQNAPQNLLLLRDVRRRHSLERSAVPMKVANRFGWDEKAVRDNRSSPKRSEEMNSVSSVYGSSKLTELASMAKRKPFETLLTHLETSSFVGCPWALQSIDRTVSKINSYFKMSTEVECVVSVKNSVRGAYM